MISPAIIQLAALTPGGLVAPQGYGAACDALAASLLAQGCAIIEVSAAEPSELREAHQQLASFGRQTRLSRRRSTLRSCARAWATAR